MTIKRHARWSLSLGIAVAVSSVFSGHYALSAPAKQPGTQPITARLGTSFELELMQSAVIKSEGLRITLTRVAEDSRCPADKVCIWEGQVTAVIAVHRRGHLLGFGNLTVLGHNRIVNKSVQKVGSYWLKLVQVDPYPGDEKAQDSRQKATLLVQNKPIPLPMPVPAATSTPHSQVRPRPPVTTRIGIPFQLMYDQSALIEKEGLMVTFVGLAQWHDAPPKTRATPADRATVWINLQKGRRVLGQFKLTVRPGTPVRHNPFWRGRYGLRLMGLDSFVEDPRQAESALNYGATIVVTQRR
ncbi:MAG: hypothetical protein M3347_09500 [Armatimonadota bacterium]|nr:hypothetical protein [Armatimonadota bacterium]